MNYLFKLSPLLMLGPLFILVLGWYFYNIYLVIFGLFLLYFLFFFFRVPKKGVVPVHRNPILAPCFGKIKEIKNTGGYIHIVTTLSLFDPHMQFVPFDGIVREKRYKKGQFNMVYFLSKSQYNERMVTIFDTNVGQITVSQIAGMITRRIHNFARPLEVMKKGEHLGFICFGSRVDMLIPASNNIKMNVSVGDRIIGGETIIAYTS